MSTYSVYNKKTAVTTAAMTYLEATKKCNEFKRADPENARHYTVGIWMPNNDLSTEIAEAFASKTIIAEVHKSSTHRGRYRVYTYLTTGEMNETFLVGVLHTGAIVDENGFELARIAK